MGPVHTVSLKEARERAATLRLKALDGVDIVAEKRAARRVKPKLKTPSFADMAAASIEVKRHEWTNSKHAAQWSMTLGPAYCSAIRDKAIGDINVDDILKVLSPVWNSKPETARRIRMRLERGRDAARVKGLRDTDNPARWKGHLDHLLPRHNKASKGHHAAMPYNEVPAFMAELAARDAL